jgi:hypothetical protein
MPRGLLIPNDTGWLTTGRRRHRHGFEAVGLFRRAPVVILQIEETRFDWYSHAPPPPGTPPDWHPEDARKVTRWRDARPEEMLPVEVGHTEVPV